MYCMVILYLSFKVGLMGTKIAGGGGGGGVGGLSDLFTAKSSIYDKY